MRLRMASRRTRDSSRLIHRGQRTLVLRDADPSGPAPQDEGWEVFPAGSGVYHLSGASISPSSRARPGISARQVPSSPDGDPGSPLRSGRDDKRGWKNSAPGRTAAKCGPAARSRKGGAQRNLVRDPAQRCAAQRLVTALRQDGSALRAESCAGPRTPFRSAPGFRGRAAERHFGFRGRAAERHFGVPGTCGGAALWVPVTCRSAALCLRVATPRTRAPAG